jgi:hypothetical protein
MAYSRRSAMEVQAHGGKGVALGEIEPLQRAHPRRVELKGSVRQLLQRSEVRGSAPASHESRVEEPFLIV